MNQSSASATPTSDRNAALRAWEIGFLALLVAGLLAAFWIKSHKEHFTHDEFFTAVLAGNPSLPAMLDTIRHGGETNPPLYFVIEWFVARGFGTGETAMRAVSALGVALAAVVVVFFTLRKVVGPEDAAVVVALVFGLSHEAFSFMTVARYYGLFLLLGALLAFLFVRINSAEAVRRRDVGFVFLVHAAMVYLHLYGALFSGMFLVAQLAVDWLRGRWRWRLSAAVLGAWVTFLLWAPALSKQFAVTSSGTWTPRLKFGVFVEELSLQSSLALTLALIAGLAVVTALARREEKPQSAPGGGWVSLVILALAWMTVPLAAWALSQVRQPIYLLRYVAPCVVAQALILAVVLGAARQLPRPHFVRPGRVPDWLPGLATAGIVGFCLIFQPLLAFKAAPLPAAAFTDQDFGHPNLPMVFEDSMDFLPRAYYGKGREYLLLIDHAAAEASAGYFTKQMERLFTPFRAHFPEFKVRYAEELPGGPEGFLLVHSPLAETFAWVLKNRPGFTAERLGVWSDGREVFLARRAGK